MTGIKKLDTPLTVDILDWAFQHLGCNALVEDNNDAKRMTILAYSEDKKYNNELYKLKKQIDNSTIFTNTDEDEVNSIEDYIQAL